MIDNMAYMPYNNYKGEYMADFEVIFYEKENGDCPVEEFIDSLDVKMRAKMIGLLELLEEKGNQLREPYSKPIDDGIFEIRCKVGNNITRVLYFFYYIDKKHNFHKNNDPAKCQSIPFNEVTHTAPKHRMEICSGIFLFYFFLIFASVL